MRRALFGLLLLLFPFACKEAKETTTLTATATATATPKSPTLASSLRDEELGASPPTPTATPSATTTAIPARSASGKMPPPPPSLGMHLDGSHFSLEVGAPGPCAKDAECTFLVRLTATDGFHVNDEYPYKLSMDPSPDVTFPAGGVFTKNGGDFRIDGKTQGTMTVRYRSAVPGAHALAATYKLSVCSEAKCQMETAKVPVTVAIQ